MYDEKNPPSGLKGHVPSNQKQRIMPYIVKRNGALAADILVNNDTVNKADKDKQNVMPLYRVKYLGIKDKYRICECGSGKKWKFCCKGKTNGDGSKQSVRQS